MDLGIALCHFELTAKEAGLEPEFFILEPDIDCNGLEYIASYKYTE